jgi:hypothetical protein
MASITEFGLCFLLALSGATAAAGMMMNDTDAAPALSNSTTTTTTTTFLDSVYWPEQTSFGVGGHPLAFLDFLQRPVVNRSTYHQSTEPKCVNINNLTDLCSSVDHCVFDEFYDTTSWTQCTDYSWLSQPEETRGDGGYTCGGYPSRCKTSATYAGLDCTTAITYARPGTVQVGQAICGADVKENVVTIPSLEISSLYGISGCSHGDYRYCRHGSTYHTIVYGGVRALDHPTDYVVPYIFNAFFNLTWNCPTITATTGSSNNNGTALDEYDNDDPLRYDHEQHCTCTATVKYDGIDTYEECSRCTICDSRTGGRFAWDCRGYSVDCYNNYTIWNITTTTTSDSTRRTQYTTGLFMLVVAWWIAAVMELG